MNFKKIKDIYIENLEIKHDFLTLAENFIEEKNTVLLLSENNGQYHILGIQPWLIFTAKNHNVNVEIFEENYTFQNRNPLDILDTILKNLTISHDLLPIAAGLMGYFSYDTKNYIEKLSNTCIDENNLPDIWLMAPAFFIIQDIQKNILYLAAPVFDQNIDTSAIKAKIFAQQKTEKTFNCSNLQANLSKNEYLQDIKTIQAYIQAGDVYQINYAQRFQGQFQGNSFAYFTYLYQQNPAAYFAYLHCNNHSIISSSPEQFIKQKQNIIETRPIKGTRARSKDKQQDNALFLALKNSEKEQAELTMIVDLLRNDFNKICIAHSVKVLKHREIKAYTNVWHAFSIIQGTLKNNKNSIDIIRSCFPGGSITGCPKIRAMEIIDILESYQRHIYTGAIGYISFHNTMELSIAIRTATILNNKLIFSLGGGIVYDSQAELEYQETLDKGKTLMSPCKEEKKYLWFNGRIQPKACISVLEPGFQYGYGIFETLRADYGKVLYLDEHLKRFYHSWSVFFQHSPPVLDWQKIITLLLEKNKLQRDIAAIKILAAKENILLITAKNYQIRGQQGLKAIVYPYPRQSPLADYKTLNYLYYLQAGQWAKSQHAEEAIILNPDGSISETNTGNLLVFFGNTIYLPQSKHVLPGIMQKIIVQTYQQSGYIIKEAVLYPNDLKKSDKVLMTNALVQEVFLYLL